MQFLSLVASGDIHRIEDAAVPAFRALGLLAQHGPGQGGTEAIAACEELGYTLCSNDGPVRRLGASLLSAPRATGSIRLLQWCVGEQLVECVAAFGLFGT